MPFENRLCDTLDGCDDFVVKKINYVNISIILYTL